MSVANIQILSLFKCTLNSILAYMAAPKDSYLSQVNGIVKPDENRLGRTLLPYYRHFSYALGKEEYAKYRETVRILVD